MVFSSFLWWYAVWYCISELIIITFFCNLLYKERKAFIENRNYARYEYLNLYVVFSLFLVREVLIVFIMIMSLYQVLVDAIVKALKAID